MMNKQQLLGESDENLLQLFSNSKENLAIEVLFERYVSSAYHLAFKYMHNQADAEDVVQKSFIKIMRFSADQNQPEMVKAWIMKTVINTSKNEIRDLIRHRRRINAKPVQENLASPETVEDTNELRKILVAAIQQLPEHFRLPIWLTHYENMSVKEVSDCLGKPEKTIRTQISRGLEKLELALKGRSSYLNSTNILALLAECKSIDKAPVTLYEKLNTISNMKISANLAPKPVAPLSISSSMIMPILAAIVIGISCFFWWQNGKSTEFSNVTNKPIQITNKINALNSSEELNYFCDFSTNEIPSWCAAISGTSKILNDSVKNEQYLKIEGEEDFVLKLNIPIQKKPYKVSYDFIPKVFTNQFYSMQKLTAESHGLVIFKFDELPLKDEWAHIEIVTYENVRSIWVNKKLALLSINVKEYLEPVNIELGGVNGGLDNIKVESIQNSYLKDISKCLDLAEKLRTSGKNEMQIPSPYPEIKEGMVKVYVINSK